MKTEWIKNETENEWQWKVEDEVHIRLSTLTVKATQEKYGLKTEADAVHLLMKRKREQLIADKLGES